MHGLINTFNKDDDLKYKVLFLGYSKSETLLIDFLIKNNCMVCHTSQPIYDTNGYDIVVSFGYKHIIKSNVLSKSIAPIINLHISYLPWNRGAHPNFWSFFDGTPSGVTIHLIDSGVDTGNILYQKYVYFENNENTFSKTYAKLISSIEELFIENFEKIISKKFKSHPQIGIGTYHSTKELPTELFDWNADINSEINRIKKILNRGLS